MSVYEREYKRLKTICSGRTGGSVEGAFGVERVVRLSANENPYGTSPAVREAVIDYVTKHDSSQYPDGNASSLRTALANHLGVAETSLVIGVGLDEVITMLSRAFLTDKDSIVISTPTFSEYALNAQLEGAVIKGVPCDAVTGATDLAGMLNAIDETTKLVWLCNPNNPTGTYCSLASLRDFMNKVPQDVLVLIDEAYIEFVTTTETASALPLLKRIYQYGLDADVFKSLWPGQLSGRLFSIKSGIGNYVQAIRLPYNLNSVSQVAAEAALMDQAFIADVCGSQC
mgnify:CR=1 FL=1